MHNWNRCFQLIVILCAAIGIGCASPTSSPQGATATTGESASTTSPVSSDMPKAETFDQADGSLFEVKEPHKIEEGRLHLQASQESTMLLSSAEGLSPKEYTVSVSVMPPGVGEHVGLAFAQSGNSNGLFYLYRPANANRFEKKCSVGLNVRIRGREVRDPDIRVRELPFELDKPIKLSIRHVGPTVFLLINDENIGRFREQYLKPGKVGVYGRSQHADGSTAIVRFDGFEIQ